ncbi:MAG: hypothetical protein AMXMBFR47_09140 [Planctomycetota bacterium]
MQNAETDFGRRDEGTRVRVARLRGISGRERAFEFLESLPDWILLRSPLAYAEDREHMPPRQVPSMIRWSTQKSFRSTS